jgi:hypothetical protein
MFSELFMDSFTLMICSHLVGRYAQIHEAIPRFKGGLAPWQSRRVVDLFHEHLDGDLKLETLCMVRRTIARALSNERSSLLLCIRPSGGDVSPGHDEFRACLF